MKLETESSLSWIANHWQWSWSTSQPLSQFFFNNTPPHPTTVRHPSKGSEFLKNQSPVLDRSFVISFSLYAPSAVHHFHWRKDKEQISYQVVTKYSFLWIVRKWKIRKMQKPTRRDADEMCRVNEAIVGCTQIHSCKEA